MGPKRVIGIFHEGESGGRIAAIDKRADRDWTVAAGDRAGAREGELVEAEELDRRAFGLPKARIVARLGDPSAPRSISLIAIHEHGIPDEFPAAALAEARAAQPMPLGKREDLRALPFVTIDPSDARDHDDAVFAQPTTTRPTRAATSSGSPSPTSPHYVTPGSALDREARRRGNSTYFPDRVVPMLPEELSADLCSLVDGADRPAIAVRLTLDAGGHVRTHRFARALIRSAASLTYTQAQAAADGQPDAMAAPLVEHGDPPALGGLGGRPQGPRPPPAAQPRPAGAAHRPLRRGQGALGRLPRALRRAPADRGLHDPRQRRRRRGAGGEEAPPALPGARGALPEKLEALREIVDSVGLTLARGQVLKTAQLNRLLDGVAGTEHAEMVNMSRAALDDPGLLRPGELRPFRPQPAALRPLHLADPPLRRPRGPPRPDPRPPLGRRTG